MSITAMKQALEALEEGVQGTRPLGMATLEAITDLRQAIEQAEKQEPVAWMSASRFEELRNGFTVMTTLTKQRAFEDDVAIHTTPPAVQRQWVGLCDTDIGDEYVRFGIQGGFNRFEYAVRAIEAKLKEKNT